MNNNNSNVICPASYKLNDIYLILFIAYEFLLAYFHLYVFKY